MFKSNNFKARRTNMGFALSVAYGHQWVTEYFTTAEQVAFVGLLCLTGAEYTLFLEWLEGRV